MTKLIQEVITVLLERLDIPPEEIGAVTEQVVKKEYRTMFDTLVESVLAEKRMAREEGREKGREEERVEAYQEKLESARMLKGYGVPIEVIAKSLHLTPETVAAL
ncbi:hypothetical protein LQZ21_07910 [Treponema sp. TIM-1]|uniref:hypothetical protein n=1 Tax=Treponema sp. TIM-1 TaxID=2898417 RepID=UPI003980DC66